MKRSLYRARQFFTALLAPVDPAETETALRQADLPPGAADLFRQLPRPYRRHALNVFARLYAGGNRQPALLRAALLHDSGKWNPYNRRRVALPYRVANTVLRRTGPGKRLLRLLGSRQRPASVLRYPFVLQIHHAELGSALARRYSVDPDTITLIRLHEQPPAAAPPHLRDLLVRLQEADDAE